MKNKKNLQSVKIKPNSKSVRKQLWTAGDGPGDWPFQRCWDWHQGHKPAMKRRGWSAWVNTESRVGQGSLRLMASAGSPASDSVLTS